MSRVITFKGAPLTVIGRKIEEGQPAPSFNVTTQDLKEASLSDFSGKIKIISSFPSLDTPVCDLQVKEFNRRAAGLSSDTVIIGISKDLPFAQKRFCSVNEIKNEIVLSDYKTSSFGINYGLLIPELNLLARSVLIIDKNDTVRYFDIVPELTSPPDYEKAMLRLKDTVGKPAPAAKQEVNHCTPCETGGPSLPKETVDKLIAKHRGWQLVEDKKIVKEFVCKDFLQAKYFLDIISVVAQEQGHHPTLTIIYNKLKVTLTTHAVGGLSDNDFIMARIIDDIGGSLL